MESKRLDANGLSKRDIRLNERWLNKRCVCENCTKRQEQAKENRKCADGSKFHDTDEPKLKSHDPKADAADEKKQIEPEIIATTGKIVATTNYGGDHGHGAATGDAGCCHSSAASASNQHSSAASASNTACRGAPAPAPVAKTGVTTTGNDVCHLCGKTSSCGDCGDCLRKVAQTPNGKCQICDVPLIYPRYTCYSPRCIQEYKEMTREASLEPKDEKDAKTGELTISDVSFFWATLATGVICVCQLFK